MHRMKLAGSTAIGIVLGAVLFNAAPAYADWPVIDAGVLAAVQAVKGVLDTVSSTINDVKTYASDIFGALGDNTFGTVQQLLQEGFTQEANYSKASIGAQQQIADASNTAMARFSRDMRNAQIRDEQTPSPTACAAIDGGVSTQSAAVQAWGVGAVMSRIHDLRGEAAPGMPSYYGQAQGVASMAHEHLALYCDATDVAAGLCGAASSAPDADQQVLSLFGSGTYTDQNAVSTAKDYAINLIEPVAPAALRGDQLSSTAGQDAALRRRSYNARMSLAQGFLDDTIGMQTPAVPLTALQQQYLQEMGLPAQTNGSWLQAVQIEAERRFSSVSLECRPCEHAASLRGARDRTGTRTRQLPAVSAIQDGDDAHHDQRRASCRGYRPELPADGPHAHPVHCRELAAERHEETRMSEPPSDEAGATSPAPASTNDTRSEPPRSEAAADKSAAAQQEQPQPVRELLNRMQELQPFIAGGDRELAQTIQRLVQHGADPDRHEQPGFRHQIAYALQDIEKNGIEVKGIEPSLRTEMAQRAASAPGLENERALALMATTASTHDKALIRDIRLAGYDIGRQQDQHTSETQSRIDALENRVRLSRRPAEAKRHARSADHTRAERVEQNGENGTSRQQAPNTIQVTQGPQAAQECTDQAQSPRHHRVGNAAARSCKRCSLGSTTHTDGRAHLDVREEDDGRGRRTRLRARHALGPRCPRRHAIIRQR